MIGIVTTTDDILDGKDVDSELVVSALCSLGQKAQRVVWHDKEVVWSNFDLLLLRSPWDYPEKLDEFLLWMEEAEKQAPILNAPSLVRWNLCKSYLLEMAREDVAIVPTTIAASTQEARSSDVWTSSEEIIVKPDVSVGSRNTGRFEAEDTNALLLAEKIIASGKQVLLQPVISSVQEQGEKALVYFDGVFSHAVCKGPILSLGGGYVGGSYQEKIERAEASPEERRLAEATLLATERLQGEVPLYARFDIVAGEKEPLLLEAEVFEPSLFLATSPGSADRFAEAILEKQQIFG